MLAEEFVNKLIDIVDNYKTIYVYGCFGSPMNERNKKSLIKRHEYNALPERASVILSSDSDTFGFDCVNLIKGILWGWSGDNTHTFGGAEYVSNDVPDYDADHIFETCSDVSTDFSHISVGEAVWIKDHIGVYIGNGMVIESTPEWKDGVQITVLDSSNCKYPRRTWEKHGKLPYIVYDIDNQ